MKRPLLYLSALVIAASGAFFVAKDWVGSDAARLTGAATVGPPPGTGSRGPGASAGKLADLPDQGPPTGQPTAAPAPRTLVTDAPLGGELISFRGFAMVQPQGEPPFPASSGTVDVEVFGRGHRSKATISIVSGVFEFEVSNRASIAVRGGVLDGQKVRFLKFRGPISPDPAMNYALVGEPVPLNLLRVFDGVSGAPLAGLSVRWSDGPTAAPLGDGAAEAPGKLVMGDAPSPLELPYLDAQHPIWLLVEHAGYGTGAVLLDPRQPNDVRVDLWPAADLTIRVTGPGRKNLKALILKRHEPGGDLKHFATYDRAAQGIKVEKDALVFPLRGLPSLPIQVEVRGFDARGRTTVLGQTKIELSPSEAGVVDLRLEKP